MITTRMAVVLLSLAAVGVGCRPDDQRTDTVNPQTMEQEREDLDPALVAQLDSGNAAFRADDYAQALEHYTRATELGPDVGSAWFGVYMAQTALGNAEAAAEALEHAQSAAPGASLIHPPINPDTTQ